MITETFQHVPGIGPSRERELWERGVTSWKHVVDHSHGLFAQAGGRLVSVSRACLDEAAQGRFETAGRMLKPPHHWRALMHHDGTQARPLRWLALDIETTGLDAERGQVTVVGLCGHATDFEPVALVADQPDWWHALPELLAETDVLLTFNGRSFDVPFLRRSLGAHRLPLPPFHVDLYWALKDLGERGGLKRIQTRLGFGRDDGLDGVDGYTAVLLWYAHKRGQAGARETLVRYCLEDVVVLLQLARYTYDRAAARLGRNWTCWHPPAVSVDHLPFFPEVLHKLGRRRAF